MTPERIQHLKDVIFTRETLKTKDRFITISHDEAKEFFDLIELVIQIKKVIDSKPITNN